jgi:hypothetical protein
VYECKLLKVDFTEERVVFWGVYRYRENKFYTLKKMTEESSEGKSNPVKAWTDP